MLVEEVQQGLVSSLVLFHHLGVLQVATSCHPAVNLGGEGLDVVGDLQVGLESVDVVLRLVLGCQHCERHLDGLCIVGVDHCRVSLSTSLEEVVLTADRQRRDLSAPAVSQNGPRVKLTTGRELVSLFDNSRNLGKGLGRGGLGAEEVAELFLVLIGGRGVPGDISGAALEEVGDDHAVFLLIRGSQDIGTLESLVEEAEDVFTLS